MMIRDWNRAKSCHFSTFYLGSGNRVLERNVCKTANPTERSPVRGVRLCSIEQSGYFLISSLNVVGQ